jgi:hypothetical protein
MLPVVAVDDPSLVMPIRAGARRASGGAPLLETDRGSADAFSEARATGAQIIVAVLESPAIVEALNLVEGLGGRGLPVLGVVERNGIPRLEGSSEALLTRDGLVALNVAVPVVDALHLRTTLWDDLRRARIEERHHLVEVDGRPAIAELGWEPAEAVWRARAAGAAGVLAGRMAAANRRWQAREDG